ncbi:M20 family metallopeptidase [Teichococcus aestuarii]|uniref:M20 family metallopeptidase n=1 Tax=Teichococcus aestuarii TaxID=568898 RepID=UPI003621DB63
MMRNDSLDPDDLATRIGARAPRYTALADSIWEMAELRFAEHRSVAAQIALLEAEGFRVTRRVAGLETAFMAEAVVGQGGPVIGFLGEFDALAGLSQEAGNPRPAPLVAGGNGHGCGHHLLGTGAMLAAAAARDMLVAEGLSGTIRYYGCPAEEGGSGKTFMAREGVFDDLAAAICWHPGTYAGVMSNLTLANFQVYFRFRGRPAHAAGSPHLGRSALDAVEIMNMGANYLREHIPSDARLHYAITDAGGISPNVVQANAEVLYLIRSPKVAQAEALFARVRRCAEGAAHMTETELTVEVDKACSEVVPNTVLEMAMHENIRRLGPPRFDEEDRAFAAAIRESLTAEDIESGVATFGAPPESGALPLPEEILAFDGTPRFNAGSTDVGDVSWVVPTVQCWGACYAIGTPFHTWQMVAQGRRPAAHKGMLHAAQAMAATALDAIRDPEMLARARAELTRRTGGRPYACPIPPGVVAPPLRAPRAG